MLDVMVRPAQPLVFLTSILFMKFCFGQMIGSELLCFSRFILGLQIKSITDNTLSKCNQAFSVFFVNLTVILMKTNSTWIFQGMAKNLPLDTNVPNAEFYIGNG